MTVPGPWSFALLALAGLRVWWLLAHDTILDGPRDWTVARLGDKWDVFLMCPFCAGFWITAAWWGAWQVFPHWTLVVAVLFALSIAVAAAGVGLSRLAD